MGVDTTDCKQTDNEIRKQAALIELAHDAILVRDLNGRLVFWNLGAEETYGYTKEHVLGRVIHELLRTQFPASREEIEREVLQHGQWRGELLHTKADGTTIVVASRWALQRNDRGEPEAFLEINRDITERKRAEEAMRVSYRILTIVNRHTEISALLNEFVAEIKANFHCEAVGIRLLNEEGKIPYSNYVGFPKDFYEMESPLSVNSDQCMCINVIKGTTDLKLPFCTTGGSFYMNSTTRFLATVSEEDKGSTRNACNAAGYESVALVPIRVGDQILGLIHLADREAGMVPLEKVELLEGIGLQLAATILRVRAQDMVKRQAELLEQRVKERTLELQQATQELESFSYAVAHDLKTPLRAIQGFSRMLLGEHAGGLDGEGRRLLQVVVDNTQQMSVLISDLLNLARMACQQMRKVSLDLTGMAKGVFLRLQSQEPGRDLQFIAKDSPPAWGDSTLLYQVLLNLLENAFKFSRDNKATVIEVGGRSEGKENIYYVKDNGLGFNDEDVHKMFMVFQRLHHGKKYEGTGVGLATVQRIIQRHGGRVWAEGEVGKGATFCFTLPRQEE